MNTPGIDPQMLTRSNEAQEMVRFKVKMDSLKQRLQGGNPKEKQLKEAAQNFEAVFISKMWQQMKATVPKEGYMHNNQEDMYLSMFDRAFSEKMAKAGGIGLADMIYGQLSEKLKETSRDALTGKVDIKPVKSQPIALNRDGSPIPLQDRSRGIVLEQWGGDVEEPGRDAAPAGKSEDSAMSRDDIVSGLLGRRASGRNGLSDAEVQRRIQDLTRRLEAERDGTDATASVGRIIAKKG